MNRYGWIRAVRMLLYYWKAHVTVMLQIGAGIAVIYASMTIYFSIQSHYHLMMDKIDRLSWTIVADPHAVPSQPPLAYSQYVQLQSDFPEARFPLYFLHRGYFMDADQQFSPVYFLYASDEFIRLVLHAEAKDFETGSTIFVGQRLAKPLGDGSSFIMLNPHAPTYAGQGSQLSVRGRASVLLSAEPIEQLAGGASAIDLANTDESGAETIPLAHTVLLPLTAYYSVSDSMDTGSFRLDMQVREELEGEAATAVILQVLDRLMSWNGGEYTFQVNTQLQALLLKVSEIGDATTIAGGIAALCLLIVTIGLVGLTQVLFQRRKQEMAVSIALGIRKSALWFGLALESTIPSLLGGVLGTAGCAWYLQEWIRFKDFEIQQHLWIVLLNVALSALPGMFSIGALTYRIRNLKPLEIVRREQG